MRHVLLAAGFAAASALAVGGPVQVAPASAQPSGRAIVAHIVGDASPRAAAISARGAAVAVPRVPFHARDAGPAAAARATPRGSAAQVRSLPAAAPPRTPQAGPLTLVTHDSAVTGLGQDIEPPDTQLAAGPTQLWETVNDVGQITNKAGLAVATFDLNSFFLVPAGSFFTDPHVLYDAESGRWFVSGLAFNPTTNASQVYVDVSANSDAAAGGTLFTIDNDPTHVCDQPKLGVNTDKVTVSCSNFSTTAFTSESTFVLNKSDLLAPRAARGWAFTSPTLFSAVPVVSLSATSTAFMVENDSNPRAFCSATSVVLTAFNGVPTGGAATAANRSDTCLPLTATAVPPGAAQPAGGVAAIATNDDRFLSATWEHGQLWIGGNDSCTPAGDTTARACLRLVSIGTFRGTIASFDFGSNGASVSFPAVTMDPAGDLFASYTTSSSTTFASTAALTMRAGTGVPDSSGVLQAGNAAYRDDQVLPATTRWGDYSAASPDPASPGSVWVTAEFARASTAGVPLRSWATATAEVADPNPATSAMRNEVGVDGAVDAALWHFQDTPPMMPFSSPGGGLAAAPAVVSVPGTAGGPATPVYVVAAADRALYTRGPSQPWQALTPGGTCTDNPAAVVVQTKPAGGLVFAIACRGVDNALRFAMEPITSGTLPSPSGLHFTSLGGILVAGPSVAAVDPHGTATVADELTFFVVGTDGAVWSHTANPSSAWVRNGWQCRGHVAVGTAVTSTTEASMLACHGSDGQLWITFDFGGAGSWGPLVAEGGALVDGPGAAMDMASPVVYVEGADGALWRWEAGVYSRPGGLIAHGAAAAALLPLSANP